MNASSEPEREEIAFGRAVDWDEQTGGTVKFRAGDYTEFDPITPKAARKLEAVTDVHGHDLKEFDDYVGFGERIADEMGNRARVGLMGYMKSPEHGGSVVIDGIIAVSADGHSFPVELQRDCFEEFRYADDVTADDDTIYVWMD